LSGRDTTPEHGIEIRRIDTSGHLLEERIHDRHWGSFASVDSLLSALATTADLVETEIRALVHRVHELDARVDALEKERSLPRPRPQPPGNARGRQRRGK
jgi:hypothetical protein